MKSYSELKSEMDNLEAQIEQAKKRGGPQKSKTTV